MSEAEARELVFVPLGGAGEIGMNLNLYGIDGKWVMIDCGITFADETQPGIDVILPDPTFIAERRDDLVALVLTHAHEDHVGAVAYLWPRLRCPVYATPFTAAILRRKLDEAGLTAEVPLHVVELGATLDLDPFTVTYVSVTHSIPEGNALAIRTRAGLVFHTGDWKLDPDPLIGPRTDENSIAAMGDDGVLAMVCDSTNVFREGESGSEAAVRTSLTEIVGGCVGARLHHVFRLERGADRNRGRGCRGPWAAACADGTLDVAHHRGGARGRLSSGYSGTGDRVRGARARARRGALPLHGLSGRASRRGFSNCRE